MIELTDFVTKFTVLHPTQMELQTIQNKIYEIRGQRVMLDFDLAVMYQIPTKALKQAVKRNTDRFPSDFMFQLTDGEWKELVTKCDRLPENIKHSSVLPSAFTQEGVASLSGVLRSPVAVNVYIEIMRAFVAMRNYLTNQHVISVELSEIRSKLALLERADEDNAEAVNDLSEDMRKELDNIYEAIAALSVKVPQSRKQSRPIGYKMLEQE